MKHTNLILALLLVVALLLTGCGGKDEADVGGQITPAPATTPAETTAPTEETPVSMGVLEGGTYHNSYAGFGCDLDANWTIYPADQLQDLPENVAQLLEGTELEGTTLNQFTDVLAENVTDLTTFNVLYQKLSPQERLAHAVLDEEEVIDGVLEETSAMLEAYANAGILVESMEKKAVTFLGEERIGLYTVSTVQDVPYYMLQIFDYDLGSYSIVLTVASYWQDSTQAMLDLFYPVS